MQMSHCNGHPLHAAAAAGAPPEVFVALLATSPEAAQLYMCDASVAHCGTPLHIAAACACSAEVLRSLLAIYPGAAAEGQDCRCTGSRDLPLHLSLRSGAPAAAVALLLEAHPHAAAKPGFWDGELPLMTALCAREPPALQTVAALLAAHAEAARTPNPKQPYHGSYSRRHISSSLSSLARPIVEGALPLHAAAAAQAPLAVLELLLAAHPEAAQRADAQGRLPLHAAAAAQAPLAVLELLLAAHPEAVQRADAQGRLPLHLACVALPMQCPAAAAANVSALLGAFPAAVRAPFSSAALLKDIAGALPLHAAIASGAPAEAIAALVAAYPESVQVWFGMPPGQDPRKAHHRYNRWGLGSIASFMSRFSESGAGKYSQCRSQEEDEEEELERIARGERFPVRFPSRKEVESGVSAKALARDNDKEEAAERGGASRDDAWSSEEEGSDAQAGKEGTALPPQVAAKLEAEEKAEREGWEEQWEEQRALQEQEIAEQKVWAKREKEHEVKAMLDRRTEEWMREWERHNSWTSIQYAAAREQGALEVLREYEAEKAANPEEEAERKEETVDWENRKTWAHEAMLQEQVLRRRTERVYARVKAAEAAALAQPPRTRFTGCLPLHIAGLAKAPEGVTCVLLRAFPGAAEERSTRGWLALHFACAAGAGEDVVAALLAANPGAASQAVACYSMDAGLRPPLPPTAQTVQCYSAPPPSLPPRWLPLELACMGGAPAQVIALLLGAYPAALHTGTALRVACQNKAPLPVLRALLAAYPSGAALSGANGMLPMHLAALATCPPHLEPKHGYVRTSADTKGPKFSASAGMIGELALAHPLTAQDCAPYSPLSLACGTHASLEVVLALLEAYPQGARVTPEASRHLFPIEGVGRGFFNVSGLEGVTLLHAVSALPECPDEVVVAILNAAPEAASVQLGDSFHNFGGRSAEAVAPSSNSPRRTGPHALHLACSRGCAGPAISALVAAFPDAVRKPWHRREAQFKSRFNGSGEGEVTWSDVLPLGLALAAFDDKEKSSGKQKPPPGAIGALLAALTLSGSSSKGGVDGGASLVASGSAAQAVNTDALVAFLLERGEAMVPHFSAACDALTAAAALPCTMHTPNASGRTPFAVAGPLCRAEIQRRLFLLGRYELQSCVHESATSRVFFALDHGSGAPTGKTSSVALKFMKHSEHYCAELQARERMRPDAATAQQLQLSVLPILASHSCEGNAAFAAELAAKALDSHPWLLVMAAGDRSLEDVVAHESAAPGWAAEAARAGAQVAGTLGLFHACGLAHMDVKPRNVLRIGTRYHLIDFDAAAPLGSSRNKDSKLSTAYAPPEAFTVLPEGTVALAPHYLSSAAVDAWGLGALLYRLLQGSTLVHATDSDNARGGEELRCVAGWEGQVGREGSGSKAAALRSVSDPCARNLLAQLLHARPERRPTMARALQHPFFTGRQQVRLPGEPAQWDVFLSYRVASDAALAEKLHAALEARGLRVYWDKLCLLDGKPWREGFFRGLVQARCFLPILSRGALKPVEFGGQTAAWGNWEALTRDSAVDNVLLEHRAALECYDRGLLEFILPLFVGDMLDPSLGTRGSYFAGGCAPAPAPVAVAALEAELALQLDRAGLGTPYEEEVTVRAVFERIKAFQGKFLEGSAGLAELVGGALERALQGGAGSSSASGAAPASGVQPLPLPQWQLHGDGSQVWFSGPAGEVAWNLPEGAQLAPPSVPPPPPPV